MQPGEELRVEVLHTTRDALVVPDEDRIGGGGGQQIHVLGRPAVVIHPAVHLGARVEADDARWTALHQGHMSASAVEVLSDVMPAVAGANHDSPPARPCPAGAVLAGMKHGSSEVIETRKLGPIRGPSRHA